MQLAPGSAATRISLSRCLLRAGDATDAVAQIETAAAIEPAQAVTQNQAGELLGRLGRLDQAAALFRRASQLDPTLVAAHFNIAMADLARGDMDAAHAALQTVTGRWPGLAVGWLQLGGVLNASGRYLEAERALCRHLELDTDSVVGRTWLGAALQFQGRFDQAEQQYRAALERAPDNPDALANLGKLLQVQGEPDQAESCFRRALAADPTHDQARSGLAAWLDNQGRQTEALALLEQGPDADPGVVAPIRARLLRKSGRGTKRARCWRQRWPAPRWQPKLRSSCVSHWPICSTKPVITKRPGLWPTTPMRCVDNLCPKVYQRGTSSNSNKGSPRPGSHSPQTRWRVWRARR